MEFVKNRLIKQYKDLEKQCEEFEENMEHFKDIHQALLDEKDEIESDYREDMLYVKRRIKEAFEDLTMAQDEYDGVFNDLAIVEEELEKYREDEEEEPDFKQAYYKPPKDQATL